MKHLADIRAAFLNYFKGQGHEVVSSSPLVPRNDPTLLFTNAGMVQFKDVFTGLEKRPYTRAATAQKCLRAGGKHNDLENVGYTARHHTFFEMLGNFSFGDYFKDVAIELAWNLVTKELQIPESRLIVTVYAEDEEATTLWKKIAGLSDNRIIRISTSDNFWSMGDTGPCGPCSEIFFDHGEHIAGGPPGSPDEDGDRFVEIWNLVFMQYEQLADGRRINLPKPSIDTGSGLERLGAVLQGVHNNYDTDVFASIIEACQDLTRNSGQIQSHRVIADHLRASAFLIADGVLPSNEGRGYVLRRIMRRGMRHAHMLGAAEPLMWRLIPTLCQTMGTAYPELLRAQEQMTSVLKNEEIKFRQTLERGLMVLNEALDYLKPEQALPGDVAFKLYDTYGFPLDLTQDVLKTSQRQVDIEGFNTAMDQQRAQARAAWSGSGEAKEDPIWFELRQKLEASEFMGYETPEAEGIVLAIIKEGKLLDHASEGETVAVIANQTPFYAESGGQMGDMGLIIGSQGTFEVTDTQKRGENLIVHFGRLVQGTLSTNDTIKLSIDDRRRKSLRAHHSATHLLHAALRQVLGSHVMQKGSLVAPDSLRFDFAHTQAMTEDEIKTVESLVNEKILENPVVSTEIMTPEAAIAAGAMALFGERYGDEVRVLSMGQGNISSETFSVELCGGTHVERTGDIGFFKIASESGVAAGVRRIIAKTGLSALQDINAREDIFDQMITILKSTETEAVDRLQAMAKEKRDLERQVADLRQQLAMAGGAGQKDGQDVETIGGFQVTAKHFEGLPAKDLKPLADNLKNTLGSGVVILASTFEGKVSLVVGVTDDLTSRVSAVELVRIGAEALGGKGGGGRPDMAQAGGADPHAIPQAFKDIKGALLNT